MLELDPREEQLIMVGILVGVVLGVILLDVREKLESVRGNREYLRGDELRDWLARKRSGVIDGERTGNS